MGSCPVNLSAINAAPKLVVINFRKGFEALNYAGLGNLSERCVTAEATCKRGERTEKLKTADHFDGLFVRVL